MSRQSSAALAVVPIGQARVKPSVQLSAERTELWRQLVDSMPPGHFHGSDEPLLRTYVDTVLLIRQAQAKLDSGGTVNGRGKISAWLTVLQRTSRLQVSLAMALRLAPQARLDRTKAASHAKASGPDDPWGAQA